MATKKKEYNLLDQGKSFISEFPKAIPIEPEETAETDESTTDHVNKGGRPKSRGETYRASVFLDADLKRALTVQSAVEGKSISVLVSEIVRQYLKDKGAFHQLSIFDELNTPK